MSRYRSILTYAFGARLRTDGWAGALACALLLVTASGPVLSAQAILEGQRAHPVEGGQGMVATSHHEASRVALDVLRQGGNAIDAAVTAGFVLAVTQPRSGNIGGGGFMLISNEKSGDVVAIDYREKAPAAAHEKLFQDEQGDVVPMLSRFSHKSAGVPGTVAGFALALEKYGTLSLAEALAPAIALAEEGFQVPLRFTQGLRQAEERLKRWPSSDAKFYKPDGGYYAPGDTFVQPELAATLRRIAQSGVKGFYEGETARLIVEDMAKHGGLITTEDLRAYRPVIRKPVQGSYRGYDVYSMSPPSSGGTHIVQILNTLEGWPIRAHGHNTAKTIHLMAEAMRVAYADRAEYLGDPDFVDVPLDALTSKAYAAQTRASIDLHQARPSETVRPGDFSDLESHETTHFSVVDGQGNAVSNTYTINFSYGSGIVVPGAGFLLNNEMDDFSAKPGVPNAYGLIGGVANKIEPGKRMLSSMSPTIVKKSGRNFLVTGSPGGSRIITTTLQVLLNVIDHDMNIQSAVNAPRVHHQWLPDELRIEQGISLDTRRLLEGMGHDVVQKSAMGAIQSVLIRDGKFYGAADPRNSTSSAMGF